jgi:mono/diheme cytochrome c family protein
MTRRSSSNRLGRGLLRLLAIVVVLGLLAWLATQVIRGTRPVSSAALTPSAALIKQGEYVAQLGDCAACHTAKGGKPFAGGLAIAAPIGTIYSSNISPDAEHGIGNYSYADFERAVRQGVKRNGDTLYPAMPYPSYAGISDQDMQALYAYFMHGVAPVAQATPANAIRWPLSLRWPLTYWRWLFAPRVGTDAVVAQTHDPVLARGAYLVDSLGHCGACHTPRAPTLQERATSDRQGSLFLSGGAADNWLAPSLRGEMQSGLGRVSESELTAFLKSGRTQSLAAFGGMSDVVAHSTRYMTDADLDAVARYLKSLSPHAEQVTLSYDSTTRHALYSGDVTPAGARLYVDNCATCHRTDGRGYGQTFPALAGNPVVNGAAPDSLIRLVLRGSTMPAGRDAPTQFSMPAFESRLSDQDIAEVLSFVRAGWGNQGAAVTAEQVQAMRASLPADQAGTMTDYDPRNH